MTRLLKPPVFDDEDRTLVAQQLFIILWTLIAASWPALLIALFLPETLWRWITVVGAVELAGLALLVLNRCGYTRLVGHLLIVTIWAITTGMALTGGGTSSNAMAIYLIVVLIAGLVQSGKAAVVTAVFCGLTGLFLALLEYGGALPARQIHHTPLTQWIAVTVYITIIGSLQLLVSRTIKRALGRSRAELAERQRVEKALQRQNYYLESLNETALGLMRRTDLAELFQSIVIRAVGLAGTDEGWIFIYRPESGEFECKAILGQKVHRIGSRFRAGEGISAEVWRTGKTVLVEDYHRWPQRARNRDYGMRRATLAIPLRSGGRLAGILGLAYQGDEAKRFARDEIAILERLAELASIALDNAGLYERMKRELTERRQAEEENFRLVERLQRSEKMEALGKLAGAVAHDLNNILGILSGHSELLLLDIPEGHRSRARAEKILQSTEKGASIIQDLLTLTRRGVAVSEVVSLNAVVEGFLKSPVFERMKEQHPAVTFRASLEESLLHIKGSPIHLEKTLMNLVANAAESIAGAGEVTIGTQSRYLDRAVRGYDEVREGDYAVLRVSDNGMGIPAENRERIFEPFYTKKTMGRSGTGLGLAIVWGTVKDHAGYIDLLSEVGRGTTFTLYFPATREAPSAPRDRQSLESYQGGGETVLVVDDIAEQRDIASGLLIRLGYRVHVVSSGEEALAYLGTNRVDIVVLDMIMDPGIDGLETYRRILDLHPGQKAVLVSGYAETDRVRQAQRLGAGAYIKKPYMMERIGMAIREELARTGERARP